MGGLREEIRISNACLVAIEAGSSGISTGCSKISTRCFKNWILEDG